MTRLRFILLLLVFGAHLAMSTEGEDEDEVSGDEEEEVTLTKDICTDALNQSPQSALVKQCCVPQVGISAEEQECKQAFDASKKEESIAMHDFANCIFIKKKFTKGNENLNFIRIKADLAKLDDARERQFRMQMYRDCNEEAKLNLAVLKSPVKSGKKPSGMRRPFYVLVFMCLSKYSQTTSCPYFLWEMDACGKYIPECRNLLQGKRV